MHAYYYYRALGGAKMPASQPYRINAKNGYANARVEIIEGHKDSVTPVIKVLPEMKTIGALRILQREWKEWLKATPESQTGLVFSLEWHLRDIENDIQSIRRRRKKGKAQL